MSGRRIYPVRAFSKKNTKSLLSDIVDFGPDTTVVSPCSLTPSGNVTDRVRQLMKRLQEINQRIDKLASRL